MNSILSISRLFEIHNELVKSNISSTEVLNASDELWKYIEMNHRCNQMLWHEEDLARRSDVEPREIMLNKRAIDQFNQKRNDAIERIDFELLSVLQKIKLNQDARQSSETAGSMIDRLSILSLKLHATYGQIERKDVSDDHIKICNSRFETLTIQRQDLATCLDYLLSQFLAGKEYFKIYKQYKMYNDPQFNQFIKNI